MCSSSITPSRPLTATLLLIVLFQKCRLSPGAENNRPSPLKTHNLLFSSQQQQIITATSETTTNTPAPPVEVPDFVEPVGNHTVAVGRDAQLACKINRLGSFRTAWLRVEDKGILTIHNKIITRNYRVGLINNDDEGNNFILTIKNVQPSDKGGYMCQINSVPMRYAIGYLDVLTPPFFDDETNSTNSAGIVVVGEGSNASLKCQANGHPVPDIVWRREDNEPIRLPSQEDVTKIDGPMLNLSQVNRINSGAYLCIASNGVQPSASKRIVLDVQYRPIIRLPQTEVESRPGQAEARLICLVELNPLGSYHWVKLDGPQPIATGGLDSESRAASSQDDDDQALIEHYELTSNEKHDIVIKQIDSETVQMLLTVRHVEKSDLARYKCVARNKLGIQSSSILLHEPAGFLLNATPGGPDDTGPDSAPITGHPSNSSHLRDQHMNDQQQGGPRGASPMRAGQYLSTRANSRSSWIQRTSSPSRAAPPEASSAHTNSSLFALERIFLLLSFVQVLVALNLNRNLARQLLI